MPERHYWRVIVMYSDGETSGSRVCKDRAKAETFAARQKKSPAIKWFRGRFYFSSKRGVGSDIWRDLELSSEQQCFIFTFEIC
jgi:hypothetical protein